MQDWNLIDRQLMGNAWIGSRIAETVTELCDEIGVRWAGTPAERAAAEAVARRFDAMALSDTRIEPFPLVSWKCRSASLRLVDSTEPDIDVRPSMFCPSVSVESRVIDAGFGMPATLVQIPEDLLRGSVVLIDGGHEPFSEPLPLHVRLQSLTRRGVEAAIVISSTGGRRTADFSVNDWRDADPYAIPLAVVQTSREDGARLRRQISDGATVTVDVDAQRFDGESWNVMADLTGSKCPDESLVLSAHHDTTTDSYGANDNAAGVAVLLETAQLLVDLQRETGVSPGRTIRFVSFGAEEQVLQGSRAYVAQHHGPEPPPRLMINLDELAAGPMKGVVLQFPEFRPLVQSQLDTIGEGYACHVMSQLDVSGDMFPFSRAGIPTSILWRWRFVGRHPDVAFGHTNADTPDKLRMRELKEYAGHLARLLLRLSHVPPEDWPENQLCVDEIERRIEAERGSVFRTM
ncbi:MAG: M28 family peptidase [Planctomycetaceae bacterium]|nr:M28 family peptidase [Planctomycetaceae bacterium]